MFCRRCGKYMHMVYKFESRQMTKFFICRKCKERSKDYPVLKQELKFEQIKQ